MHDDATHNTNATHDDAKITILVLSMKPMSMVMTETFLLCFVCCKHFYLLGNKRLNLSYSEEEKDEFIKKTLE